MGRRPTSEEPEQRVNELEKAGVDPKRAVVAEDKEGSKGSLSKDLLLVVIFVLTSTLIMVFMDAYEMFHTCIRRLNAYEVDDILLFLPFFSAIGLLWFSRRRTQAWKSETMRRRQAEDALRKARDELERLVQIRTARLVITNEQLKEEIEDRHLAEVALRNSEEKYATLVENSLTGIYINEGEKILFVNKRFARIYGYAPEELLGMESRRLVHPEDRPWTDQMRARRLRGEDVPSEYEARGLTKDGKTIWIIRRNTLIEYKGRHAILGNIVDITQRKQAEKALERSRTSLRRLSSRLIQVQEKERQRISRELHDSIGQSLSAVKFALENKLSQMRDGPAAAKGELLESIIPMVQQASEDVRRIHTDLRPSMLDDLGIIATISWFCREFEKLYSGVRVEKQANIRDEEVPEPLKIVIFRVLQEALNNVSKYSNAGLVRVSLMGTGNKIELVVEDNGQGFDVGNVYGVQESSGGFGLTSMRERTELSEGFFTVESTPGAGTTVRASWPYNEKKPTSQ